MLKHMPRPKQATYLCRAVLPVGNGGIAVGIPAEVRDDLGIEAGKDGNKVDLTYDREEREITIHFPPEAPRRPAPQLSELAADGGRQ